MANDGHLMNIWCVSRPKSSPKIATEFSSGPLFFDQGRPSAGCQLPLCLMPNTGCLEMAADLKKRPFPTRFLTRRLASSGFILVTTRYKEGNDVYWLIIVSSYVRLEGGS